MRFAYEDLSYDQFEELIVIVCQHLLGISVKGFARGPDGGRDAKFVGTAELHPSKSKPWQGTTIIQAKHTNGYNRHFGETDFFSNDNDQSIIRKEVPRIRKLKKNGNLDHYMLFSNRRLSANADQEITDHISSQCGIATESIYLCGIEQLELYLRRYPEISRVANLDPVDSPLIVSPDEIATVVEGFAKNASVLIEELDVLPTSRTSFERKNELNSMTSEYADELKQRYLRDTAQIRQFLAAPGNEEVRLAYEAACEEFQLKITSKRKHHQSFDEVMEYLLDLLYRRDPILRQRQHKRLVRSLLFYMYWNCDIGKVDNAEAK